jgi:F0F1-type ATP synthase assembly protein I
MNEVFGVGKRLVMRVVLLQAGCAATVATMFWAFRDAMAAWAGLAGGLIVAIGSAVFGWRMFAPGIAPAAVLRRALFAAESLKWFWYVLAVWLALTRFKLPPLPLMTGLVFAQFGYWFGLVGMKRGKSNGSV